MTQVFRSVFKIPFKLLYFFLFFSFSHLSHYSRSASLLALREQFSIIEPTKQACIIHATTFTHQECSVSLLTASSSMLRSSSSSGSCIMQGLCITIDSTSVGLKPPGSDAKSEGRHPQHVECPSRSCLLQVHVHVHVHHHHDYLAAAAHLELGSSCCCC